MCIIKVNVNLSMILLCLLLTSCVRPPKIVLVPSPVKIPHVELPKTEKLFTKELKNGDKLKPDIVIGAYVKDLRNCRHENKTLRMELEAFDE